MATVAIGGEHGKLGHHSRHARSFYLATVQQLSQWLAKHPLPIHPPTHQHFVHALSPANGHDRPHFIVHVH